MTDILTTITSMAIHRPGKSPVYGDTTTHISMADEAAGIYFEVKQDDGMVRLEIEELRALVAAAETMLAQPGAQEDDE